MGELDEYILFVIYFVNYTFYNHYKGPFLERFPYKQMVPAEKNGKTSPFGEVFPLCGVCVLGGRNRIGYVPFA